MYVFVDLQILEVLFDVLKWNEKASNACRRLQLRVPSPHENMESGEISKLSEGITLVWMLSELKYKQLPSFKMTQWKFALKNFKTLAGKISFGESCSHGLLCRLRPFQPSPRVIILSVNIVKIIYFSLKCIFKYVIFPHTIISACRCSFVLWSFF